MNEESAAQALLRLGLQAPRFDDEEEARLRDLAEPDDLRAVVDSNWTGFRRVSERRFSSGSSMSFPTPTSPIPSVSPNRRRGPGSLAD
jgi:hypothetical protein